MRENAGDDPNTDHDAPVVPVHIMRRSKPLPQRKPRFLPPAYPPTSRIPKSSPGKFRLDEETKTYLTNCEKLAPRSHKAYAGACLLRAAIRFLP